IDMKPLISVLVPVYNWQVSRLSQALLAARKKVYADDLIEIRFLDDSSPNQSVQADNRRYFDTVSEWGVFYRELPENRGRAVVRNTLSMEAQGDWLLFLDADVVPDDELFLLNYCDVIRSDQADAVCGGTSYRQRTMTGRSYDFYVYLVSRAGEKDAGSRNMVPWRTVLTSNMLIKKILFETTPFDARFLGYGYEDQEWGIRLQHKCRLLHIDNTVSHLGLQTKQEVYRKMRESVKNYHLLRRLHPEMFAASGIARIVRFLESGSAHCLRKLDRLLERAFWALEQPYAISYCTFQLNKAVLLALEGKREP
ncbi:MAG TPA: glycosyltransferase family 2 protein, partial [Candidatus Ozemobacteraceae bacterium]|nr:glycosyltransferase family 2 protein [Candidatus Ozemobacteraceae bacterium]